jgi:F420-dependent oxidoreductase-like protein
MMPKLGVQRPRLEGGAPAEIRAAIEWIEALGYESLWLGEAWGQEAFSQFGWIAAFTKRIKIGCGIVNVYSRTPALIGQAAATVDQLSGGRFLLGLGSSGHLVIQNWHGLAYERPLRRLREYLEIVRLVTSGERVNYDGEMFHLRGFKLQFPPVRPRLPIYVASLAPASVRQTGELADGWNPVYLDPASLPRFRAELAAGAARAGRAVSAIEVAPQVCVLVTDDPARARRLAAGQIAHYICRMGVHYARHIGAQGYAEEVAHIQRAHATGEDIAAAVHDRLIDALAIVGPEVECRARLEEYAAAGVDQVVFFFPVDTPVALARQTLEALAPAKA